MFAGTVGIIGGLLLLGGLWFYFGFSDESSEVVSEEPIVEVDSFVPQIVTAKHQFKNGKHIVAGEVEMPNPCYLLETDAVVEVREPYADRATLRFTSSQGDDLCAQVITPIRFKESFGAQEEAEISATWNGKPVKLNLIEVGSNEDLDSFELYIKG